MEVNWLQILDVDVADFILWHGPSSLHNVVQRVVIFCAINHLISQVETFLNPVTANVNWNNDECFPDRIQVAVSFEEPADRHIRAALSVQFASSEALTILEDCSNLVSCNNLAHHSTIYIATLKGLAVLPATANVPRPFQNLLHKQDPGNVFEVAEGKAALDALWLVNIHHDKEVDECLVKWHQDDLIAFFNMFLYGLEALHVDVQAL